MRTIPKLPKQKKRRKKHSYSNCKEFEFCKNKECVRKMAMAKFDSDI